MRFPSAILLLLVTTLLPAGAGQPNILLIMADDLRTTLGCYGDTQARTPHLDKLAARGVRFEHAYAQYPVCNPSRTSLMLGMRCEQTEVVENATFFRTRWPDIQTLPQLFRANGYTARSFGKIYHAGNTGNDTQLTLTDNGKSWDSAEMFTATAAGSKGEMRNLSGGKLPWCNAGIMEGTDDDQPDGQCAAKATQSIRELTAAGRPWFIAAGFHRPHDPFLVPRKYWDLFPPDKMKLPETPADTSLPGRWTMPGGAFQEVFSAFSPEDQLAFFRAYYAGCAMMDAQVGRIMATLDELQLWKNTIVLFVSDHGYHLGERTWWNKNTLFDRSCRVPLIVCAPGMTPGVAPALAELVDIYPTLTDLAGLAAPAHRLAGQSFRQVLEDPAVTHKDTARTMVTRGNKAKGSTLRTDRWRYTEWITDPSGAELYDLQADPGEWHNLATVPAHADTVKQLSGKLKNADPWEEEITRLSSRLAAENHAPGGVAFVGSSTMRMWDLKANFPDRKDANCGFGGATTADLIRYFDRTVAPLRPRKVVFYCGGNDISAGRTPARVFADFKAWVRLYRRLVPDGRILYLGIRPCGSRAHLEKLEREYDGMITDWVRANAADYITTVDTSPSVRDAAGALRPELFLPDRLHLSPAGYLIWNDMVRPFIKD